MVAYGIAQGDMAKREIEHSPHFRVEPISALASYTSMIASGTVRQWGLRFYCLLGDGGNVLAMHSSCLQQQRPVKVGLSTWEPPPPGLPRDTLGHVCGWPRGLCDLIPKV